MTWLSRQQRQVLEHWVRQTDTPMMASLPDGRILFANAAFCKRMQYTERELCGNPDDDSENGLKWTELSTKDSDLVADLHAAEEVVTGVRMEYWIRKHYVPKGGASTPVLLHVLRYPMVGEFEFCLVTAHFLEDGGGYVLATALEAMEARLVAAVQMEADQSASMTTTQKLAVQVAALIEAYPIVSTTAILIMLGMIFGPRIFELIMEAIRTATGGAGG